MRGFLNVRPWFKKKMFLRPKEKKNYCCLKREANYVWSWTKIWKFNLTSWQTQTTRSSVVMSPDLYFLLYSAFVDKKNVFPVRWNFLFIYVDLKFFWHQIRTTRKKKLRNINHSVLCREIKSKRVLDDEPELHEFDII